jgi:peptide/nickel transport system substrate-binding protein
MISFMTQLRKTSLWWFLLALTLLAASPAASQDEAGLGAIVEGNPARVEGIGSLNPLRCSNDACARITDLLFPTLLGIDHETRTFAPSSGDDYVLATGWEILDSGNIYQLTLRDDLTWSDGAPITAYDVFYSYLTIASEQIGSPYTDFVNETLLGAAPLDAYTITFISRNADCTTLDSLYFPVMPAHVFEPDFTELTDDAFDADEDPVEQYDRWLVDQSERNFGFIVRHSFEVEPTVTAGLFEFGEYRPTDYIRLVSDDSELGFEYRDVSGTNTAVDLFLAGDLNFIANPPYERRADIRAADDVQIFESPGNLWYYIGFNLADPLKPQSAFDEDGNPLDQGHHPIFGDVRVRRAVQMAIDVNTLIEASVFGAGTVMAANQPPLSWALDANLSPIAYDPVSASALLDEAGWRDWNNDGLRECHGCMYADEGAALSFGLLYSGENSRYAPIVSHIQEQLRLVGIDIFAQPTGGSAFNDAVSQQYDAYLAGWRENYPVGADQTELFTVSGDVLGQGFNTTSYANERVAELLDSARTVPGCDTAARADIYHQIQAILQEDQPYAWLFAPHDMFAARGSVMGFDPYPNAPFWNVRDWRIVE